MNYIKKLGLIELIERFNGKLTGTYFALFHRLIVWCSLCSIAWTVGQDKPISFDSRNPRCRLCRHSSERSPQTIF